MASERTKAKQSAQDVEIAESPEFKQVISQGRDLFGELREHNRHNEHMKAADLGWAGQFLGGEANAAITVAFFVVVFGLLAAAGLWIAAAHSMQPDFWAKQAQISLALAGSGLSFIFGRSGRGPSEKQ